MIYQKMKKITTFLLVLLLIFIPLLFSQEANKSDEEVPEWLQGVEPLTQDEIEFIELIHSFDKETLVKLLFIYYNENNELRIKNKNLESFLSTTQDLLAQSLVNLDNLKQQRLIPPLPNPQLDELNFRLFMLQSTLDMNVLPGLYFPWWWR